MSVTIYGIRNCDTMKKAFGWLRQHGIDHHFHDYRADSIDRASIARWCAAAGWRNVLNMSSATFRALPDDAKADLDEAKAVDLMLANPTMIKRPVLEAGETIEVGFKPARYEQIFPG